MSTIHKYVGGQHAATHRTGPAGAHRELRGMGAHPPVEILAVVGWHYVADVPASPGEGYVWQPATPAYALIDGVSVPQGEWVKAAAPKPEPALAALAASWGALCEQLGLAKTATVTQILPALESLKGQDQEAAQNLGLYFVNVALLGLQEAIGISIGTMFAAINAQTE